MKTDRLMGILCALTQSERITAAQLAERFEVSKRTILRDIDDLCKAGIPIVSYKGSGGGLSVMDGFKLDKTLLTSSEMQEILAGLKGLDSVSGNKRYRQLIDKIAPESVRMNDIIIDLSSWGKEAVADKIEFIRAAVNGCDKISFTYYSPSDIGERTIEPYSLIFQWAGWYVWGFCEKRQDYRMFKLTRLTDLRLSGEKFQKRDIPEYSCDRLRHTKGEITAEVRFDSSVKWRIIDDFGTDFPEFSEDGSSKIEFTWSDVPSFYQYILSFGDTAEIISPEEYRREFKELLKKILGRYL